MLAEQMQPEALEALLRGVGRRLTVGQVVPAGDRRARLEAAVAVLNELGGLAELEERDGTFVIRGYSCPLAAAVPGHPEVCKLAETLLTEVVGVPVRECCERGEHPYCHFEVVAADNSAARCEVAGK